MKTLPTEFTQKRIVWYGQYYFVDALQNMGADITYMQAENKPLNWKELTRRAGFEPDIFVYGDCSLPAPVLGVEQFPCPTIFICVDSHIHSWYPFYAQAFDFCTVSLRDHMPGFQDKLLPEERLLWLPPFARDTDLPKKMEKKWDLLFVGNVGADIFPVRTRMLQEIKAAMPELEVRQGAYGDLYPQGKIILNIAERGDLNYRVFEVLGCGGCLLTPAIGHGQAELFEDGMEMFTYPINDVAALVEITRRLLREPDLCQQVAQRGLAKIDTMHRAYHRAMQLATWVSGVEHTTLVQNRMKKAKEIHKIFLKLLYLHLAETSGEKAFAQAYMNAASFAG